MKLTMNITRKGQLQPVAIRDLPVQDRQRYRDRIMNDNVPKIAEVDDDNTVKKGRKKKLPPLFSDTLRNRPNLSSSTDEGGVSDSAGLSGKEEWLKDKGDSPKRVTFRPLGGLQDNKLRKKNETEHKNERIGGK